MPRLTKPLRNLDRIEILQRAESSTEMYLSDLERDHFGITSYFPREMRTKFKTRLANPYWGDFDDRYDDYLLDLWDSLENPVSPAGPGADSGQPIGLLLALTQA